MLGWIGPCLSQMLTLNLLAPIQLHTYFFPCIHHPSVTRADPFSCMKENSRTVRVIVQSRTKQRVRQTWVSVHQLSWLCFGRWWQHHECSPQLDRTALTQENLSFPQLLSLLLLYCSSSSDAFIWGHTVPSLFAHCLCTPPFDKAWRNYFLMPWIEASLLSSYIPELLCTPWVISIDHILGFWISKPSFCCHILYSRHSMNSLA